ncbi:RluA family pseudouridine synthase [Patescibacteria group bacterium]|nr:RluA family pseudouridine synthase [Patescibacteria group bacterium]MBU1890460.1 RluA family pseudouridine synthase [Patescibacteria group bacterium]
MVKKLKAQVSGVRLDKYLHKELPDSSRSWLQKLIKKKKVTVNGQAVKPHHSLRLDDLIEIEVVQQPIIDLSPDASIEWETIFESPDYLIINKPSGLVVHPSEGTKTGTLVNGLLHRYPDIGKVGEDLMRPGIVHRIDKEASGLMIIAKTQDAFDYYKQLFKSHKINKRYQALVSGTGLSDTGTINFPLERSKTGKIVSVSATAPSMRKRKWAETNYEVIKCFTNYTLVQVTTITGRTHQIRAHFHGLGHPLFGDSQYSKDYNNEPLFLCAYYLSFIDQKGEKQEYSIELPGYLQQVLKDMK